MNPVQPALTAAALALAATAAEGKPLWEVGAGAGAFPLPDYRSSDQNSRWLLPAPFFTYHGNFYKAGRHGIGGRFFDTDRLELTVSAFLSQPSGSYNIPAHASMPDLMATFEIGPQVDVTLWRSESRAHFVKLRLPLRAAFTATPTRSAYEAASGYTGSQFLASVSRRYQKFRVGAFASYDNLSGATIADSPLVVEKNNFAAGVAVSWIFGESSTRVMVDD